MENAETKKRVSVTGSVKNGILFLREWSLSRFIQRFRKKKAYILPALFFGGHMLLMVFGYLFSFFFLRRVVLCNNLVYIVVMAILPILFWLLSTMCDDLSFYGTKRLTLVLCVVNGVLCLLQPYWSFIYDVFTARFLVYVPVAGTMTPGMILSTIWWGQFFMMAAVLWLVLHQIFDVLLDGAVSPGLDRFRLHYVLDFRTNKKEAYDLNFMRDLSGYGKRLPIYEDDLYTHCALIGPSGMGKTSSALIPMIICFMDRKMENAKKRLAGFEALLKEGKGYIKGPLSSFTEYDICPLPGYEKEFSKIRDKYPDCGITVVSPNSDLGDKTASLCKARGLSMNVVDASKYYEEDFVHHKCITPFYVPVEGFSDLDKAILIVEKANNFSEVIIRVNEAGRKSGETYFTDINTSVTTNIAVLCMIVANLQGRQTSYCEVMDCIHDFSVLSDMCALVKRSLNIEVPVYDPGASSKKNASGNSALRDDVLTAANAGTTGMQKSEEELKEFKQQMRSGSMDYKTTYIEAIRYVQNELIANGEKMYDQSRGLRNLTSKMVSDPRVRYVLNGDGSGADFLDFDNILSRCEITVVNTCINISQQSSTATGLFFLLNHQNAVQRRKVGDRQPHALIVDETTQYVHSWMENAISLYRQYKCMVFFSFQSTAQLEKTDETRFIKGLMFTIGNIICYGRIGPEEMRILELLSGQDTIQLEQETISQNSILSQDPSMTTSVRTTPTPQARLTGSDMRQRNFQEGSWFPFRQGNVLPGRLIKLSFPADESYQDQHIKLPDLSGFVRSGEDVPETADTVDSPSSLQESRDFIEHDTEESSIRMVLDGREQTDEPGPEDTRDTADTTIPTQEDGVAPQTLPGDMLSLKEALSRVSEEDAPKRTEQYAEIPETVSGGSGDMWDDLFG